MILKHKNEMIEVDSTLSDGKLRAEFNDKEIEFDLQKLGDNSYRVNYNGKSIPAYLALDKDDVYVSFDGKYFSFKSIDEDDRDYGAIAGTSGDREEILPPMPGSVVKIIAEEGQEVKDGDPLIIVEAMKMETTLFAGISGKVTKINVSSGQQVSADEVLVVVEK